MNTSTTETVRHHGTGVKDLDALLADAKPETLTAMHVALRLSVASNPLGDAMRATLAERVAPFRQGDFPPCDALAEIRPVQLWLDLLDRIEEHVAEYDLDGADDYTEPTLSRRMAEHIRAVRGDADARRRALQAALVRAHVAQD